MCCSEKGTKPPSSSTSQNVTSQMLKSTSSMDLCKFITDPSSVVLLTWFSLFPVIVAVWCTQSYSLVSYHVYWYPPVPRALLVNGKMQKHKSKK